MENKTSKYFKYALGEIVLVVIGILIALQINTWNENRKLENEELSLLKELKSNLETTLVDFDEVTDYNYDTVSFYDNINYYVENDLPYHTELDSAFAAITLWSSPFATTTAYKSIQNKGLDIIKNEHLKNSIIDLYDVQLQSLIVDIDQAEWALNQSVILPFFSKNIRRLNNVSLNSSSPNDFEALKQNNEFINILSMLIRQRRKSLEYFETIMTAIEDVITEIETELKSRT